MRKLKSIPAAIKAGKNYYHTTTCIELYNYYMFELNGIYLRAFQYGFNKELKKEIYEVFRFTNLEI